MSIKPQYHPYWLWEEIQFNMWGSVTDRDSFLAKAIEFTGDHLLYGSFMGRVIREWKYSCEHNLSQRSQNRQAWLGHAACALGMECPEDIVREAWWKLTDEQRQLANNQADRYIKEWEETQWENGQLELMF
jgi:hypothetical protein